jgi:integrase
MGVKIRKIRGKWYLVIDFQGRRKKKAISISRAVAEEVRRRVEARLALGDLGIFDEAAASIPLFEDYVTKWLRIHRQSIKASTYRSYEQLLRVHVTPKFGKLKLSEINRDDVKEFITAISTSSEFARNTVRLILTSLRAVLTAAVEDGLIETNPASKVGRFNKREKGEAKAQAMTRAEAEAFLTACSEVCPDYHALFFTALRAGLRKGELIALQWGDIQLGESDEDSDRFIMVTRNIYGSQVTTPKNHLSRRVDMTKQLRTVLEAWKDRALMRAFQAGKTSVTDDLVFPSEDGQPLYPDNIARRYMEPALERAGLRRFRFHDLRHTFGSLLIQAGVSPAYVQKQMGHKSIQVTVDVYSHLIPGDNVGWIDTLDLPAAKTKSATSAHQPHTQDDAEMETAASDSKEMLLPPRSTAGQLTLDQHIGVRIPGGQPNLFKHLQTSIFPKASKRVSRTKKSYQMARLHAETRL